MKKVLWTGLVAVLSGIIMAQKVQERGLLPPPEVGHPPGIVPPFVRPPIPRPPILPPIPPPRIELPDTAATPMQVKELSIAATVRGLHATVGTTMVFLNPNTRPLEGDLVFPLPDGAAVCGYALDINGVLTDGVVVKKEKARVAFETETRRRVDPGLVEHVKGNLYRTRIFPLPPNGTRTVRLTYTTPLSTAPNGDAALSLPMPREAVAKRTVKIEVAADNAPAPELGGLGDRRFTRAENFWRVETTDANVTPGEDVWVALPKLPATYVAVEKDPDGTVWFFASALAPTSAEKAKTAPGLVHVLWDASGSREGKELSLDYALLEALPATTRYRLLVFRDAPEAPRDFDSSATLVAALKEVPYDGGTDFAALAAALPQDGAPALLFTDGLDTLTGAPLEFGAVTPIAIVSKTVADREALRQACAGALIDLQTTEVAAAIQQILNPAPRVAGVKGKGVADVQGLGRPAIGRVSVLGRLVAPEADLQLDFGGAVSEPCRVRAADAREGRTLATAWAAARVMQLSPRAEMFEDDLLELGRRYGLVSPATSLLVLESLDQWLRHEIEPPASLPELRDQWRAAMKGRGQQTTDARAQHLAQVAEIWKQRVAWWKTDFSKTPLPVVVTKPEPTPMAEALASDGFAASVDAPAPPPRPASQRAQLGALLGGFAGGASAPAMATMRTAAADRELGDSDGAGANKEQGYAGAAASAIQVKAWDPDTPYLKTIKASGKGSHYAAYLTERKKWAQSPAFFLDCAEFFLAQQDTALGLRILSNLAELKIEDSALLRVYAWRLRQAEQLDRAVVMLRRVATLRGEEPQSFRDLALVLAERGKKAAAKADLEEAMNLLLRVVQTPWARHGENIAIFALEELNALVAWSGAHAWKEGQKPAVPEYDEKLRDNLDTDIRIIMAWDADATDIDLHVAEPGGEEAYYGHNRTARGGLVSQDITDGYGPEEYLIRRAPQGSYAVKANYYGSGQQTVVGPATATATVYTDWGRPTEKRQTLALRLDKPRDMVTLGSIVFGTAGPDGTVRPAADFSTLRPGMTQAELAAALGEPAARDGAVWRYSVGPRTIKLHFDAEGRLVRAVEALPGGVETVLAQ